jgi:GNAT superfamily N-acetyltransferase
VAKYISAEQTLFLISSVLRNNMPLEGCVFTSDNHEDCFYLGYFGNGSIASVTTFFPENYPAKTGSGFRLRGMATDPDHAGKGYGREIINFALEALTSINGAYIWCNARSSAIGFLQKTRICNHF